MHIAIAIASAVGALLLVVHLLRPRSRKPPVHNATEPGIGWQEEYMGGSPAAEAEFVHQAMRDIHVVQRRNKKSAHATKYDRAFHAKILAGIENAMFCVLPNIPEMFRVGFLQPGKKYRTTVRFSNASGKIQADTEKDLRGAALEVEVDENEIHDFLMTNAAASHARDVRQFVVFAKAAAGSKLLMIPRLIWGLGFRETLRMLKTVVRQVSRPVESLVTEEFWSRSPYKWGKRAGRFALIPTEGGACLVEKGFDYLSEDLIERLKRGPVVFNFGVQLWMGDDKTPLEDGAVEWKESDSPFIIIAQLVIPQQDLTAPAAQAAKAAVNAKDFNPWWTTDTFRPLGSLNRGRKLVYEASLRSCTLAS